MSKHAAFTITPSESIINAPLTPPPTDPKPSIQVSRIIKNLRLWKEGHHEPNPQPWTVFRLQPGDFELLLALIQADPTLWPFFCDKVRHDYFSLRRYLVLRMPTSTHEFFRSRVVLELQRQLGTIANRTGKVAEFARAVKYAGSPRLQFPADESSLNRKESTDRRDGKDEEEQASLTYDCHEPDAAFKHIDAQWPGVIIEVSFSQKEREIRNLAEDYILGSDGNIRVVIGLNVEYKKSKKATLSIWRPQYIKHEDGEESFVSMQTLSDQPFRDELGNPTNSDDKGLSLQLNDFASSAVLADYDPNTLLLPIAIPSLVLYEFLTRAEAEAKEVRELAGKKIYLKPGAKKRQRTRTPPEELESEDERRFVEEEEKAAKKVAGGGWGL